jgi:hypothetical protein
MRFTSQANLIQFDLRGYRNVVDKEMTETTKEAARSWLRTVLSIVPTWSRASRATFNELAEAVGFTLTFGPVLSRKDRLSLGLQTSRGGIETDNRTFWKFFYETDLRYLAYNELNRVIFGQAPNVFSRTGLTNPTPYKFQEAGIADFNSFSEGVRLPDPTLFIKPRRI